MNLKLKISWPLKYALGCVLLSTTVAVSASEEAKHFPGVFIGVLDTEDDRELATGVEYEYRFDHNWGAGIVYEYAADAHHDDDVTSTIAAMYYHPHKGWRVGVGAGQEKVSGGHGYTKDLFRVGVAYDFHVGGFGIAPTLNIDSVDGDIAQVYGVAFSIGF